MTTLMTYLNAHPLIWAALAAMVIVTVLKVLARIACMGMLIVIAFVIATYIVSAYGGYA